jgi:hypothetical protein
MQCITPKRIDPEPFTHSATAAILFRQEPDEEEEDERDDNSDDGDADESEGYSE